MYHTFWSYTGGGGGGGDDNDGGGGDDDSDDDGDDDDERCCCVTADDKGNIHGRWSGLRAPRPGMNFLFLDQVTVTVFIIGFLCVLSALVQEEETMKWAKLH